MFFAAVAMLAGWAGPAGGQGVPGAAEAGAGLGLTGESICASIQKLIHDGKDGKIVVRTAIELGHSACVVVQCAVAGGGSLERVLAGAVEAGASPDVISRCAIDGGAVPGDVAEILSRPELALSLCYFQPEGAEFLILPVELPEAVRRDPFPVEQRRSVISPFTFP